MATSGVLVAGAVVDLRPVPVVRGPVPSRGEAVVVLDGVAVTASSLGGVEVSRPRALLIASRGWSNPRNRARPAMGSMIANESERVQLGGCARAPCSSRVALSNSATPSATTIVTST
jgi:hypothetical protein